MIEHFNLLETKEVEYDAWKIKIFTTKINLYECFSEVRLPAYYQLHVHFEYFQ